MGRIEGPELTVLRAVHASVTVRYHHGVTPLKKTVIIPARGGSKGIPRKNLLSHAGKPLLSYAVEAGLRSSVGRVIVSTDDDEIASVAAGSGAEVIRQPSSLSGDFSTDIEVFTWLLSMPLRAEAFDYVVHLRATFPDITASIVDAAVGQFEAAYDEHDSLRSVIKAPQTPYKMWHIDTEGCLSPVIPGNTLHSIQRQRIPQSYWQNACVDIVKTETVTRQRSMVGKRCMPFLMTDEFDGDVDCYADFLRLQGRR